MGKVSWKRIEITAGILILLVVLSGCGSYNAARSKVTTISVNRSGVIVNAIIEDFSQSYYDVTELKKTVDSEINDYNSAKGDDLIKLKKLAQDGNQVRVIMTFHSAEDFADFNQETFFYGTAESAKEGGIEVPESLCDADGKTVQLSAIKDYAKRHVIVTADKSQIVTPYPIEYVSAGVKLISETQADLSAVKDETIYLLLEK